MWPIIWVPTTLLSVKGLRLPASPVRPTRSSASPWAHAAAAPARAARHRRAATTPRLPCFRIIGMSPIGPRLPPGRADALAAPALPTPSFHRPDGREIDLRIERLAQPGDAHDVVARRPEVLAHDGFRLVRLALPDQAEERRVLP